MRLIKYIAVHCTATAQSATVESIQKYWREHLKWQSPGYHFIIKADGTVINLQPVDKVSNGVAGYNHEIINVSYIGGIDATGKPKDTRTAAQKVALINLLTKLKADYPTAIIQGHRDFPKVAKACPSFDAKTEYKNV